VFVSNVRTLEPIVVPPHLADKPSADAIAEWQHFTGFLLALAGVCMKSGKGGKGTANLEQYFTELMELTGVRSQISFFFFSFFFFVLRAIKVTPFYRTRS
jgi:hypothetical protein